MRNAFVALVLLFAFVMPAHAACDPVSFLTCRNLFDLQGCIDTCPYVPTECPATAPPNTECTELDPACSDECWDTGTSHGSTCASHAGCSLDDVQEILRGTYSAEESEEPEQVEEPQESEVSEETEEPTEPESPPSEQPETTNQPVQLEPEPPKQEFVTEEVKSFDEAKDERPRAEAVGEIISFIGEAEIVIFHEDDYEEIIPIEPGGELPPIPKGASIFTGDDTFIVIKLADGKTVVKMSPVSELTLDEAAIERAQQAPPTTRMRLRAGKVDIEIERGDFESHTEVVTPQNVAAVIGTIFTSAYDKESKTSYVEVQEGVVEVTSVKTGETRILMTESGSVFRVDLDENGFTDEEYLVAESTILGDMNSSDSRLLIGIGILVIIVIFASLLFYRKSQKK